MKTHILPPPAYSVVQDTEQIVSQVALDDLVAVFTRSEGGGGLLVYNRESLPGLPAAVEEAGWRSVSLAAMQPGDYARYDGPVISVAAIDVLLDAIPTHGVHFFPIEDLRLFRQPQLGHTFARTASHLVEAITERWRRLSADEQARQRPVFCKRVIQLCLPDALEIHQDPDLVALRFDLSGAGCRTVAASSARPVFDRPGQPDDILSLADLGDGEWIAGLRELPIVVPSLDRRRDHLLPLRPALRRFVKGDFLRATCRRLALRCWRDWERLRRDELLEAAYVLAAEAWLEDRDATDLVAILPISGFEKFVDAGQAVAVSRGQVPAIPDAAHRCSLEGILQGRLPVPNSPVFALPVLAPALRQRGAGPVFDLGAVFSRAERYPDLARTFWLLSRDLLQPPNDEWRQVGASVQDVTEMAQRAALIYGLGNPWAWRQGRYSLLMSECYTHLDRSLQQQQQDFYGEAQAYYYAALRAWYDCALADDVMGNVVRVAEYSRLFAMACEDVGMKRKLAHEMAVAGELEAFARGILHPDLARLSAFDRDAIGVSEALRGIANGELGVPLPSSLGIHWLQEYLRSYSLWRKIRELSSEQRPDPSELDQLQNELSKWRRRTFAPQHELRILLAALAEESEQIRRLQQAVGEGAVIKLVSRTSEISLGAKQTVVIEAQNIGSQMARELTLTLERFAGLELVAGLPGGGRIDLSPGERQRVEVQVRAVEPTLVLVFSYRFRDHAGRLQTDEERVYLQARSEARGLRSKVNPFEVGRPVFGKGYFFGRSSEISQILSRLAKGDTHPLVLRGPRRIGKSSLLRQIANLLDQPGEARDAGFSSDLQAALRNLHPVLLSLQNMDRTLPRPFEAFLSGLLQDMCSKLALDAAPIVKTFEHASGQFGTPRAFMQQIGDILRSRPGERAVVLLDELDEVFRADSRETAKQLRNIIEGETRISWIAASTMLIRASAGQYGSPWFNLLEPIELRAMEWSSAFQLLRQLGNRAGFDWSEEAIAAALDLGGRRPYLAQLLAVRVTDDLNAEGRDRVTGGDVAAAASDLLDEISLTGSYLGFVWNEARWLGKLALWEVLQAPEPLRLPELSRQIRRRTEAEGIVVDTGRFDEAFDERIAWLTDIADTLEIRAPSSQTSGRRRVIGFAIPLVQRWLKQMLEHESDFLRQAVSGVAEELEA